MNSFCCGVMGKEGQPVLASLTEDRGPQLMRSFSKQSQEMHTVLKKRHLAPAHAGWGGAGSRLCGGTEWAGGVA